MSLKPPPRKLTEAQFIKRYSFTESAFGVLYMSTDLAETCVRELRKDTKLYQLAVKLLDDNKNFVDRLQELGYSP